MKVGDLVKAPRYLIDLIGIITNIRDGERVSLITGDPCPTVYYTVYWQNGVINNSYQDGDLEVISESR